MAEPLHPAWSGTNPTATPSRRLRQISMAVIGCFLLSGGVGLIYEVLWTRMLGLVFGHSVFAITTVLAAFMSGLGLGSYLFGRMADRHANPLRLYGLLEVGVGVYALLIPFLFAKAEAVSIPLQRAFGLSFFAHSLAQFLLTFLILVVPTTLMGATLPVLTRFFVRDIETLGRQVARLYALNTFGAVLGTYAAGFHLIRIVGLRMALLLAAFLSIGLGALALALDRHLHRRGYLRFCPNRPSPMPDAGDAAPDPPDTGRSIVVGTWLAVVGLGISGAVSMIYEVAWTRALSLVIGSSTYAFSTMLVAFLGGLALGSFLFSRLAGRVTVDPLLFAWLQLGIGLSALGVTLVFDRLPELFLRAFSLSQSSGLVEILQFTISAGTMLLPTLFIGATFPCVVQIVSRQIGRLGSDVGRIYFINTGGAIAGTVLGGFLLIPSLGLQTTLTLAISINLCLAGILSAASGGGRWRRSSAILVCLGALVALSLAPRWDAKAMSSGVAIYGQKYLGLLEKGDFRTAIAPASRLVYYRDGISATVSVHRQGENLFLRINGKTDASNTVDMHTQLLLGHLPLLFHPDAEEVLVVGLGSGATAGAVALHPMKAMDLVEIESAVAEAASFFAKENRDVLRDPRVRTVIADGRNFLMASRKRYDVVISEPSNPWMRGIGNLFSLDFYRLVATRLAPTGIVCQWIQSYGLFPEDLKMVLNTFRSVFPHTTVWGTSPGDLLLIGSMQPLALDYTRIESRFHGISGLQEDLAGLGFTSPLVMLVADFVLGEEDAARFSRHASLNTDDRPLLEFSAPRSLYADTLESNWRLMKEFKVQELPPVVGLSAGTLQSIQLRRDLASAFLRKGMREEALAHLDEALRLAPTDVHSLLQRGKILFQLGTYPRAEADFKAVLRVDPGAVEAHDALFHLYKAQGLWDLADMHFQRRQPAN